MISIKETPTCEGCSRSEDHTPGMCSVRKGGARTYLCFDCIDDLKDVADAARIEARSGDDM